MIVRTVLTVIFSAGVLLLPGYAEDVIVIDSAPPQSELLEDIKNACEFYGLSLKVILTGNGTRDGLITDQIEQSGADAVIISSKASAYMDLEKICAELKENRRERIRFLVTELSPASNTGQACMQAETDPARSLYRFGDFPEFTRQLSGQETPFIEKDVYYFPVDEKTHEVVMEVNDHKNKKNISLPVFVRTGLNGFEIFFLADLDSAKPEQEFMENISLMLFLRYASGQRCWQSSGYFANLTIDDPWLTESYGYLNFDELCREDNRNFHTTIAFIPWNFDRSEPEVVELFKSNPDKLSLCLHGNNHDHYEFKNYNSGTNGSMPSQALEIQDADIRQALARMEKHKELTGLDYDRVMIFPQGIAPESALKLLKKYNFWATVNGGHIPLGAEKPDDPLFDFKAVTLDYVDFPSFRRYYPDETEFRVALDLFFGNPLLFYSHHDYFKKGINAFDARAEWVNQIQPDIQWRSLGHIVRHYYQERRLGAGVFEIKAFTSNFIITNPHSRDITCHIHKEEDFSIPVKQVWVGGRPWYFEESQNELFLTVDIPQGQWREVMIEYENDLDTASIDISKNDPRINRLRKISDFRDITLSRNFLGRWIISIYYDTGLYEWGIKRLAAVIILVFLILALSAGIFFFYRRRKKIKGKVNQ